MKKTTSGFTVIELIVVITVISILTALGVYSFSRIQASSRDSQRSVKITMIAEALEKYYGQNGEYPSCTDMSQTPATIIANTLPRLLAEALASPTATSGSSSILANCADLGSTGDDFAYVGTNSADGLTACTTYCLQWTLKYREEATGNIIPRTSRHLAP